MSAWRFIDEDGNALTAAAPPTDLPTDLIAGEFVQLVDAQGVGRWYVLADKSRFWDGHKWKVGGSLAYFDHTQMTEKQIYEYRRKMLQWGGWIEK